MIEDTHKRWIVFLASACGVAVLAGLGLGWLSKSLGWGFSALALLSGLAAGLVSLSFRWPSPGERVSVGLAAAGVGLAVFAWGSYQPAWQAETAVASEEVDDLCVRVTAMRLCHKRKVMGVFDFADVPEPIVAEARQKVQAMPAKTKYELCNRTFADRINANFSQGETGGVIARAAIWSLLSLGLAAGPALLKERLNRTVKTKVRTRTM